MAGLLALGGMNACSDGTRVSGTENFDNTEIEYFNVKQETKDSIAVPLLTLKSKLNNDNDFLDGVTVNIAGSYDDLDDSHSFKTFLKGTDGTDGEKGTSFYSDGKIPRIIIIQEDAHNTLGDKLLSGSLSSMPVLRHSLMHEVGHQFDEYFGHNHNADFAQKWDSIMYSKEKTPHQNPYEFDLTQEDKDAYIDYNWNAGLSDSKEFVKAFEKDLKYIKRLKEHGASNIACNWQYYTQGVDLSEPVNEEVSELADGARAETYANLFAYVIGEDDGDKSYFLDSFKNSYQVVKNDVAKYLNIKTK